MTPLEQAKRVPYGREPYQQRSDEELDMCIAWMQGEVATAQVAHVLDKDPTPAVYWIANAVRQAVKAGRINIEKRNTEG